VTYASETTARAPLSCISPSSTNVPANDSR
jgi:hypothetical protein